MIEVAGLTKYYGEQKIFEKISFRIEDGEGLFVTGSSGCGKTTLLRILAGFIEEYEGEIVIDGEKRNREVGPNERNIAMVFQEPALWNHMTVEKNMAYGMKRKDRETLLTVAKGLKIEDLLTKYPEEISGGQAKRVALARALLSDKRNLLLDEPLANVDSDTRDIIIRFLREEYLKNRCILYVTHEKEELEGLPFGRIEIGI